MKSPANKSTTTTTAARMEFPPRRGRVKKEIFGSLATSIVSAALKAGGVFGKRAGESGDSSSSAPTTTPPASGYNSDQN
ncbi:unnamed protein product [Cochlearia groenlandica]